MDISDIIDHIADASAAVRARREGPKALLPAVARRATEAGVTAAGGAVAASVAYAGVGGTAVQVGVALGLCSPPLLVAAVPVVAVVAGFAAGRIVQRMLE